MNTLPLELPFFQRAPLLADGVLPAEIRELTTEGGGVLSGDLDRFQCFNDL